MQSVGLDSDKMRQALDVADVDATGSVTIENFRYSVNSLHEPPMRLHLGILQRKMALAHNRMRSESRHDSEAIHACLKQINARLGAIEAKMGV